MALLDDQTKQQVQETFGEMKDPVNLLYFTSDNDCQYCGQTQELMEEVNSLSDKLNLEIIDFDSNKDKAQAYGIDKVPATVVMTDTDYGIRYYGIPAGYEFSSFLTSIMLVSTQTMEGIDKIEADVAKITKPLHIQVFVTPTCPHCPQAVVNSHVLAFMNEKITADMVEASEFQDLSQKYNVMGVPQIIINEKPLQAGALPIPMMLEEITKTQAEEG
jgi:glutaredoxin-like protein